MRNEKNLGRYREEQNLGETDMSLAGFVCIFFCFLTSEEKTRRIFYHETHVSQVKESDGILVSAFDGTYRWVLTDLYY
jgi:hypothetical protein